MPARVAPSIGPTPITGVRAKFISGLIYMNVVAIALRVYRSPQQAWLSLRHIIRLNNTIRGSEQGQKYYLCGTRVFWSPIVPQWPSRPFDRFVETILDRVKPHRPDRTRLGSVVMAISSRCPLHCEHCLEGDNLGQQEHLTFQELQYILTMFQKLGVVQVVFSGGEPLVRFEDLCRLLKEADGDAEYSLLTSGFGLTGEKARSLKNAGLRSIQIALDHWDGKKHNSFRGHDKAFDMAREAALNAHRAGLLVGFSLCAVEDFITWENLLKYLELVRSWHGVSVRILEPRKVGRYADRDVQLSKQKIAMLSDFYEQVNSRAEYSHLPRLSYPEYHKRAVGCFGAGNRLVYSDSKGNIHPCPFCPDVVGNALKDDLGELVRMLRSNDFPQYSFSPLLSHWPDNGQANEGVSLPCSQSPQWDSPCSTENTCIFPAPVQGVEP